MPKQIKFYKKRKFFILLLMAIAGSTAAYAYFSKEDAPSYDYIIAEKTDIIQEVSVTGRVRAAESVNLAFEVGGKVKKISASVGERVIAGQELISLVNDDMKARILEAQANASGASARQAQYEAGIKSEQAKLDQLKKGYSREEILISETSVSNAKKVISDAETKLEDTRLKTDADLEKVYKDALAYLPISVSTGKTALVNLTDIQYAYFNGYESVDNILASVKADAVNSLLGAQNAGRWIVKSISALNGGVYGEVHDAALTADSGLAEDLIKKTIDALRQVKSALDTVPLSDKLTSADKTILDAQKTNINAEITALSGKQQTISVQKASNTSAISSAQSVVTSAKNSLTTAQRELTLKKAGYTAEQIRGQEAQVEQAKANLASQKASVSQAYANVKYYLAQMDKTVLKAPISGIVTSMETKEGEIVTPGSPLVSIISEGAFEIISDIPEVDIAKVKIGDTAQVTLDAYGSDVFFSAIVMDTEPAETVIEGMSTYKTTLMFTEDDPRIKPGMTANIDILTDEKDDVIAIPQRAVITKDGEKIVRVLKTIADHKNPKKTIEIIDIITVETGLRGSMGNIEIISGLNEGDKVVVYIKETK